MIDSSQNDPMRVPDEVDFISFFEAEAVESEPSDLYWCYRVRDGQNIELQFSYNLLEQSIQTTIQVGGRLLLRMVREGVISLQFSTIEGRECLVADFSSPEIMGSMQLSWKEGVQVTWSELQA